MSSPTQLHKEKNLLSALTDSRITKRTRRNLVKELPDTALKAIQAVCFNCARGNIRLPEGTKQTLKKYKIHIETLGTNKTDLASKRKYLLVGNKFDRILTVFLPILIELVTDQHSELDLSVPQETLEVSPEKPQQNPQNELQQEKNP